jgi:hypothetical protein
LQEGAVDHIVVAMPAERDSAKLMFAELFRLKVKAISFVGQKINFTQLEDVLWPPFL